MYAAILARGGMLVKPHWDTQVIRAHFVLARLMDKPV